MNVRKNIDYSDMFMALDALVTANLPQMELCREIGRLISERHEKGAAIAAAEYLQNTFPETSGFSPRSLRRMREFYCAYASDPGIMNEAMSLGWTQNIVILEADLTMQERLWYIRAAIRFCWSKSILAQKIAVGAHISLDFTEKSCYTKQNDSAGEAPGSAGPVHGLHPSVDSSGHFAFHQCTRFCNSPRL